MTESWWTVALNDVKKVGALLAVVVLGIGLAEACAATTAADDKDSGTQMELVEPTCANTAETLAALELEWGVLSARLADHKAEPALRIVITQEAKALHVFELWVTVWRQTNGCSQPKPA